MLRLKEGKVISKKTVRKILGKTVKVTFRTTARITSNPSSAKNTEQIHGTDKMLLLKVKENINELDLSARSSCIGHTQNLGR